MTSRYWSVAFSGRKIAHVPLAALGLLRASKRRRNARSGLGETSRHTLLQHVFGGLLSGRDGRGKSLLNGIFNDRSERVRRDVSLALLGGHNEHLQPLRQGIKDRHFVLLLLPAQLNAQGRLVL